MFAIFFVRSQLLECRKHGLHSCMILACVTPYITRKADRIIMRTIIIYSSFMSTMHNAQSSFFFFIGSILQETTLNHSYHLPTHCATILRESSKGPLQQCFNYTFYHAGRPVPTSYSSYKKYEIPERHNLEIIS